jgi:hypothetical protein
MQRRILQNQWKNEIVEMIHVRLSDSVSHSTMAQPIPTHLTKVSDPAQGQGICNDFLLATQFRRTSPLVTFRASRASLSPILSGKVFRKKILITGLSGI